MSIKRLDIKICLEISIEPMGMLMQYHDRYARLNLKMTEGIFYHLPEGGFIS